VLRLGRLLESALIVHARWGNWADVLERCLVAARATGDRPLEAWVLHQIGTRAVCLVEETNARRLLTEAARLRDSLGENAAASLSRQNLGFIVQAKPEEARPQPATPFMDAWGSDSLPLRAETGAPTHGQRVNGVAVMLVTFLLCGILGAITYRDLAVKRAASRERPVATADLVAPSPRPASEQPLAAPPEAPRTDRANIRIFTARPGSITTRKPTDLCYAVSEAVATRIEPGIGNVDSADVLTCRRVAPARTTTYELTAVGRDGIPVSEHVVIIVK